MFRKNNIAVSFPYCKLKGERERVCQLNCHVKKIVIIFIIMVCRLIFYHFCVLK